jgi:hypothetical protein
VIERLRSLHVKKAYTVADLRKLLDENFEDGILICAAVSGAVQGSIHFCAP